MLENDELLPVEQTNPGLIEELRSIYRMSPEEEQVLARVLSRLAQQPYPLSTHTSMQKEEQFQPAPFRTPVSVLKHSSRGKRGWTRQLEAIAGVLFLVLLVGSLVFLFSAGHHTSVGSGNPGASSGSMTRLFLTPAQSSSTPSRQEMQTEATILSQRFNNFGLKGSSVHIQTIHGHLGLLVVLPSENSNGQQAIKTLLQVGVLDFWNTGPSTNPNAVLNQGITFQPAHYSHYNPGGHPLFTNTDLDPAAISVSSDPQTGQPQIDCEMKGIAISRFGSFTQKYIDYALTITLDGKVLSSASIASAILGPFVIPGNFTRQQAHAIASVLTYAPLPFALKQVS